MTVITDSCRPVNLNRLTIEAAQILVGACGGVMNGNFTVQVLRLRPIWVVGPTVIGWTEAVLGVVDGPVQRVFVAVTGFLRWLSWRGSGITVNCFIKGCTVISAGITRDARHIIGWLWCGIGRSQGSY